MRWFDETEIQKITNKADKDYEKYLEGGKEEFEISSADG